MKKKKDNVVNIFLATLALSQEREELMKQKGITSFSLENVGEKVEAKYFTDDTHKQIAKGFIYRVDIDGTWHVKDENGIDFPSTYQRITPIETELRINEIIKNN